MDCTCHATLIPITFILTTKVVTGIKYLDTLSAIFFGMTNNRSIDRTIQAIISG